MDNHPADKENGLWLSRHFENPPKRVVSLVPSLTESLFELGFGEVVVGVTDYCVHPSEHLVDLPRLGGPKNPRVDEIIALQPELILVNWEENTRRTVEELEAAGILVWVTFPKTVREALDLLWILVGVFHSRLAAARVESLEVALDWAQQAAQQRAPLRYFCPIWYEKTSAGLPWWMTFNRHTYPHDLLLTLGGENAFSDRERRYPLEADLSLAEPQDSDGWDTRYPRLSLEEIRLSNPELILLPNEPYAFTNNDRDELIAQLADTQAVQGGRVYPIDGSLITWHGTRLARALQELPILFE